MVGEPADPAVAAAPQADSAEALLDARLRQLVATALHTRLQEGLAQCPTDDWVARFEYLRRVEAKAIPKVREIIGRDAAGVIDAVRAELATTWLTELRSHSDLKGKYLLRQIKPPALRMLLKHHLNRLSDQLVVQAYREGLLAWPQRLERARQYGTGFSERVVELPLALAVAQLDAPGNVLDAGAALNLPGLRQLLGPPTARLTHFTLSSDAEPLLPASDRVSYQFGDLRATDFRDGAFDRIVCISTLEHVGMDNRIYGGPAEAQPETCRAAVEELLRILAPDGRLLITVPYGQARMYSWFRVFGADELQEVLAIATPSMCQVRYFYYDGCWFEGDADTPLSQPPEGQDADPITGVAVVLITKTLSTGERGATHRSAA